MLKALKDYLKGCKSIFATFLSCFTVVPHLLGGMVCWSEGATQVRVKMQIGSRNNYSQRVSHSHQSRDYLPKSALSITSLATSAEVQGAKKNIVFFLVATNKNTALKSALTLSIGCQILPKILGWLVVAKQSALWEGGSFGGFHSTGLCHPHPSPHYSSQVIQWMQKWGKSHREHWVHPQR